MIFFFLEMQKKERRNLKTERKMGSPFLSNVAELAHCYACFTVHIT